jgi:hypothetical protein
MKGRQKIFNKNLKLKYMDQEYEQSSEEMDEMSHWGHHMGCMKWPMKMKKQFMMAKMKKKEKILEAKLEFIREMRAMAEKMEMEGPKTAEEEKE